MQIQIDLCFDLDPWNNPKGWGASFRSGSEGCWLPGEGSLGPLDSWGRWSCGACFPVGTPWNGPIFFFWVILLLFLLLFLFFWIGYDLFWFLAVFFRKPRICNLISLGTWPFFSNSQVERWLMISPWYWCTSSPPSSSLDSISTSDLLVTFEYENHGFRSSLH